MFKTGIEHMDKLINNAIRVIDSEDMIIAAYFTGSLATGKFSELSDIDFGIVCENRNFIKLCDKIISLAKELPNYIIGDYYDYNKRDAYWCFLTKKLINVDFFINSKSSAKPSIEFKSIMIIKDQEDFLSNLKAKSSKKERASPISKREFKSFLLSQRADFLYAPTKYEQGHQIESIENVKYVFKKLLDFKKRLQSISIRDFRGLEQILDEQELAIFNQIYSLRPIKMDIKRGLELNWKLMGGLDAIYEQKYGKLGFSEFDKLLWNRIDELLG